MVKFDAERNSAGQEDVSALSGRGLLACGVGRCSPPVAEALAGLDRSQLLVLDWSCGMSGERLSAGQIAVELGTSEDAARDMREAALRALYMPRRSEGR